MRHQLHHLTDHVHWFTPDARTDRPILGVVVGKRATLMVDAGASSAHARAFLKALEENGVSSPSYLALTHWHWDHVLGMSALDAPIFAQRGTAQEVAKLAGYDWSDAALDARVEAGSEIAFCRELIKLELLGRSDLSLRTPDIIFEDFLSLDLGGVTCELHRVGGDHAADSSILYVPKDRILFLGDCISQAIYSPRQHYTAAKLLPLLDKLDVFGAEFYLESHNEAVFNQGEFQDIVRTLRTAAEITERLGNDPEGVRDALERHPYIPPEDVDGRNSRETAPPPS